MLKGFREFVLRGNVVELAVTVVIGAVPLNALEARRQPGEESPTPTTKTCPECASEIPVVARRCPMCTSSLS